MDISERKRAGAAVRARIIEMGATPTEIAKAAGIDPTTLRALINGRRWPRRNTRDRLNAVLGWDTGDIARRAIDGIALEDVPTVELARILYQRVLTGT